jgi:hypothetical protein
MNARIDFDAVREHRHLREEDSAEAWDAAIDEAKAQIKVELLLSFQREFAGAGNGIPFATYKGNVITQDLSLALGDVWADPKVERLFLDMLAAPTDKLAAARSTFQTAAALAYIAGQVDALAEHRVSNPELYA